MHEYFKVYLFIMFLGLVFFSVAITTWYIIMFLLPLSLEEYLALGWLFFFCGLIFPLVMWMMQDGI